MSDCSSVSLHLGSQGDVSFYVESAIYSRCVGFELVEQHAMSSGEGWKRVRLRPSFKGARVDGVSPSSRSEQLWRVCVEVVSYEWCDFHPFASDWDGDFV